MYIESSYKQLLFGVSQQDYKDRLEGQVEEQVNMTSDLTFNLRRRAPVKYSRATGLTTDPDRLAVYSTTASGREVTVFVDTNTDQLLVQEEGGGSTLVGGSSYFQATSRDAIRFTTLGDEIFIANTSVKPTVTDQTATLGYKDPGLTGFLYVIAGQYNKRYEVSITNRTTGTTTTVSYTVPDGTTAGDAAKAIPEYIAQQLATAITGDPTLSTLVDVDTYGAYLVITALTSTEFAVNSGSGANYIKTSGAGNVRSIDDLPAKLGPEADGLIISVGLGPNFRYYRWEENTQQWLEDARFGELSKLENMPRRLVYNSSIPSWVLDAPDFERRSAGDEETNPVPKFVESGITGLASFQGRLVILSNDYVNMSGSNRPLRFFRSTLESLQDDDPIEIGSTAAQAAPYVWASSFNKDLILWADKYQSIIPGSVAITPRNANISVMSQYECRTSVQPVPTGRAMFFAAPRSLGYDGMWEMLPSAYTDSQLTGSDVTNHIPRYIAGECRYIAASTTSNIVVAGFTGNRKEMLIHEYLWSGGEKVHHAWHKWVFDWDVVNVWFRGDQLYILFQIAGSIVQGILDLRTGAGDSTTTTGRLDMYDTFTVNSLGEISIIEAVADIWDEPWAFKTSGANPYIKQKLTEDRRTGGLVHYPVPGAVEGDTFIVGNRYASYVVPTAPSVRDSNDVPITTQRSLLHKWVVTLQNTGEFRFTTSDKYRDPVSVDTSPLKFGSPELNIGEPQVAGGQQYIPARLDMPTSRLELWTDDVYDLNITSLEYGFRYHQRYGRRR